MAAQSQQTGFQAAVEAVDRGATASGIVYGAKRDIGGSDPGKLNAPDHQTGMRRSSQQQQP